MAPDPATSKSRGSKYRLNDTHHSRAGEQLERGSQRSEAGKGKGEREGGVTESGRGVKRRQHGGGVDGGQGATSCSRSGTHRYSKRWRGDAIESLDISVPTDRWDGGAPDIRKETAFVSGKSKQDLDPRTGESIIVKAQSFNEGGEVEKDVPKELVAISGMSKQDLDPRSAESIIGTAQLSKEGGEIEKAIRKQKVSNTSLLSDNRAITVMELQETDICVIDANIRIKNKVNHRRETMLELVESEHERRVEDNAKSTGDITRSRRRWDRDVHKGEVQDSHIRGNVSGDRCVELDRKKEKSKDRDKDRDRDTEATLQNGRLSEGSRGLASEVDARLEDFDELENINEFKIQEGLRNIELEKELENRIRRRREESGDRDRWRDDEREREGKRHSDCRELPRDERQRLRRERERQTDRSMSRQHREESKLSEARQREERCYENDHEYRSHQDKHHGSRFKDLEEQGHVLRGHEQDQRDRKGRENIGGYELERRICDKVGKDEPPDRERSYLTGIYMESSDGIRSEHRHKRARGSDTGDGYAVERDHSSQRGCAAEAGTVAGNDLVHNDRPRRSKVGQDAEGRVDNPQGSSVDREILRAKVKTNNWCSSCPPSDLVSDGLPSPRHDAKGSPSLKLIDYGSPPWLDDQLSPGYVSQRSPSSHVDISSAPSRGRTGHGDWFESSNSVSISSGPQRRTPGLGTHIGDRHDRLKWHAGAEEEVKSEFFRANRNTDEGGEGSLSPYRLLDYILPATPGKPPLHAQDSFQRGIGSRGAMEARGDRGRWRASLQAGAAGFDGCPVDHGPDDLSPRDRNECIRRISMNRPPSSPIVRAQVPQLSSLLVTPLAPLPPPPPFRPGIDNPAVLGPLHAGFDDSGSMEQGRGDRKGGLLCRGDLGTTIGPGETWRGVNIGNWNSRNQSPLSGSGFPPFPLPFTPHSTAVGGGFRGVGQQFQGPHVFPGNGGRPPLEMGFLGGRFFGPGSHISEGGDGYHCSAHGTGWHGEVEDGRRLPHLGPGDGWEGLHADDRLRHGQMDWERGGPMGARGWDRDRERDMWEARGRDRAPDFMTHRSQIELPPQNPAFPSIGSCWGMPRDAQVANDVKPRQERSLYSQEVKRKLDGGSARLKVVKPSGRAVMTSERKLRNYTSTSMESTLAQVDISPDLAGAELYSQFRRLVPVGESGKLYTAIEDDLELIDEDLELEGDTGAEAFIAGPNVLAKILPPLSAGVFEGAIRLYRKPETENRLQKSSRGSFILPFDASIMKMPTISLKLNRCHSVAAPDQATMVEGVLGQQDVDVVEPEFKVKFIKPNDGRMNVKGHDEDLNLHDDVDVAKVYDRERDPAKEEYMSLHVEVAEYSDREFDTEMDMDNVEMKPLEVEDCNDEALDFLEVYEELKQPEVGVAEPLTLAVEDNEAELQQDSCDIVALVDIHNDISEEVPSALFPGEHEILKINGETKDVEVNSPETKPSLPKKEVQVERFPRFRKRRTSSRLLAQSVGEAVDSLQVQQTVGISKVVARETARSSQRRSKRLGSTH